MKLSPSETSEQALYALGEQARALLMRRDYVALANQFGYALAYGREHAAAMQEDHQRAAASPNVIEPDGTPVVVKYLKPNSTGLYAVVECAVPVTKSSAVLLELIVSGNAEDRHITVEDISGASA